MSGRSRLKLCCSFGPLPLTKVLNKLAVYNIKPLRYPSFINAYPNEAPMRFHVVCNPATNNNLEVTITLRDALKPTTSDEEIQLKFSRQQIGKEFRFAGVEVGLLNISQLQGTARMIRAVDSISFERGKDSLLRLNVVDFIDALIEESSTQAVYDARFDRFFAVNAIRRDNTAWWVPDITIEEEAAAALLTVSAVTEEQARKCITNKLMELIDSDEVSEQAQKLLAEWVKVKRKIVHSSTEAPSPTHINYKEAYKAIIK